MTLVLLFHLWPDRLTGGFIGVDVFFVISGFLITTHLVQSQPRSFGDLVQFWARRVRRLLPASLLVLFATLAASRLVAPETQWATTAKHVAASAVYAVNWLLADQSVDYLAAEIAPSPVQHYWSLAIEEQFYLFWPVLVLALGVLALGIRRDRLHTLLAGLAAVSVASLAYSVYATATTPTSAYFITPTRIWELSAGGVLGVLMLRWGSGPTRARGAIVAAGLSAIGYAAFTYSAETAFPGWRALVPVLGAAMVLWAGGGSRLSATALETRPARWLGDVSYSVYLWHWPLIVLLPYVSGGKLGLLDKTAVLLVTLVLAALTKEFVEDRYRLRQARTVKPTFLLMAAGMALLVGLSILQQAEVRARIDESIDQTARATNAGGRCFGANAIANGCDIKTSGDLVQSPTQAAVDLSVVYDDKCYESEPFPGTRTCTYGNPAGDVSVAVVGNSHAIHWMPAIEEVADASGWEVTTFLISQCTPSTVVNGGDQWNYDTSAEGCLAWGERVQERIVAGDFDLVIVTNSSGGVALGADSRDESMPLWVRGYQEWLDPIVRSGTRVAVIKDSPWSTLPMTIPDCVAANLEEWQVCSGRPTEWIRDDPLAIAADGLGSDLVDVIDLNDRICTDEGCPPVVGRVIVYRDAHHLTATYAQTLAPYLARPLSRALHAG